MMYADVNYYKISYAGALIPDEELTKALQTASRHIDTLTYNRIVSKGFINLTNFQKDIVKDVCCQLAEFEYENADILDNVLQSYSINGVSMSFGASWNVYVRSGVAIKQDIYSTLCQTGLCDLSLG